MGDLYCECNPEHEKLLELMKLFETVLPLIKDEYPVLASLIKERMDVLKAVKI